MPTNILTTESFTIRPIGPMDHALDISEFYCDTIQGEGASIGCPAAFLRLKHCVLDCDWCDTKHIWKKGLTYSNIELYERMELPGIDLIKKLREGQHLVITGGSPLIQQTRITEFLKGFINKFTFLPYVEIENECVLTLLEQDLPKYVKQWNNSPKLENSGIARHIRYKPPVIKRMADLTNSWFKFVISSEKDWDEIQREYIFENLIRKNQVILMPQGQTKKELEQNRMLVFNLATKHNVRYSTREHIVLFDNKIGV